MFFFRHNLEDSELKKHRPSVTFIWLIAVAIMINLFQFKTIEENTNPRYQAINKYHTGDIMEIGFGSSDSVRQYYMHAFALGEVAPGSRLYIPKGSTFNDRSWLSRVRGIGKTSGVTVINIDEAEIIQDFVPIPHVVAFGEDSRAGRSGSVYPSFAIAMDYEHDVTFESFGNNVIQISDQAPIKEHTEFVIIEWGGPEQAFSSITRHKPYSYVLFLELTLLPEQIQKEIRNDN